MKRHAEICPVCKGSGKYREYYDYVTTTQAYTEKTCHGCHGNGWVEVTDNYFSNDDCSSGTVMFSDSVTNINNYYQEFCEDIINEHVPRID